MLPYKEVETMEELRNSARNFWRLSQSVLRDIENIKKVLELSDDKRYAAGILDSALVRFSLVRLYASQISDLIEGQEIDAQRFVGTVRKFTERSDGTDTIAQILIRLAQECSVFEICLYYSSLLDQVDNSLGALMGSLNGFYIIPEEEEPESYDFALTPSASYIANEHSNSLSGLVYDIIQKNENPEPQCLGMIQKAFRGLLEELRIVAAIWSEYSRD